MKAREALIAWTPANSRNDPTAGQVKVGSLVGKGEIDWTKPYQSTGGAAFVDRRKMNGDRSILMVFVDFQTLVVRDGIDPQIAHSAFLQIDEYAETIALDVPGARDKDAE